MTIETQTQIRRRPDGSIDTGHYMARGRVARAEQARDMGGAPQGGARRAGGLLAALLALFWIGPGSA